MNEKEKKRGVLTWETALSQPLSDQPKGALAYTMTGVEVPEPGGGAGMGIPDPDEGLTFPDSGVDNFASGTKWLHMKAPTYEERYQRELSGALEAYERSRQPFTYNYATDPGYQQYAQIYAREGRRAAQDAVGQVSARTGGLASSYAASAASQAENYYAQQLADKVPELRQLAYRMYQDELGQRLAQVELYTGLQDRDRSWFVTSQLEPFYQERAFDYGVYRDTVADSQWQQDFDYQKERDAVADSQWRESFNYQKQRDRVADDQWQQTHW